MDRGKTFMFVNRGMAICVTLMCSRLGGVVGAIVTAVLLDNHCPSVFYISGISLAGKWMTIKILVYAILYIDFFYNTGAAMLTYFIPKIHEKPDTSENNGMRPRGSVLSFR